MAGAAPVPLTFSDLPRYQAAASRSQNRSWRQAEMKLAALVAAG
jgi:hypothetical protein